MKSDAEFTFQIKKKKLNLSSRTYSPISCLPIPSVSIQSYHLLPAKIRPPPSSSKPESCNPLSAATHSCY
ncbi:MAG: hypothetical protein KGD65_15530 [Candidatus Lokiarchaeota archaeon]|nr:hypothetical protein [Candidatus Lokiarchaeota archaeon]